MWVQSVPATSAPVEKVFSHGGIIMRPHRARLIDTMLSNIVFLKCNVDNMDMKSSTDWDEIIVNVEKPSCQVLYLLYTSQRTGSQTFVKCVSDFSFKHKFLCGGGQVVWADRFAFS